MFIAEIFHLFYRIEVQEDNAKSFASPIEYLYLVAGILIDDLTIDILCYLFINLYSLKRTCNIAMQDIVHKASRKCINRMREEILRRPQKEPAFGHGSTRIRTAPLPIPSLPET